MPFALPPRTFVAGLVGGRSAPIFNSIDRRALAGGFVARIEPLPWLSRRGFVGSLRYEGFLLFTNGETVASRDRTYLAGFHAGFRFAGGGTGGFFEANTGLVYKPQGTPGTPLRVNFAPMIAAGWRFAGKLPIEVGVRLTHISNWNRATPNNGLNLLVGYVGFAF